MASSMVSVIQSVNAKIEMIGMEVVEAGTFYEGKRLFVVYHGNDGDYAEPVIIPMDGPSGPLRWISEAIDRLYARLNQAYAL